TRARHQASALSQAIEELGGEPWEFPAIEITSPSEPAKLAHAIKNLKRFEWLIFTSVNGVEAFFQELLNLGKDIRELHNIDIVAIGPATKADLEKRCLKVSFVPEEYRAEKIIEGLASRVLPGQSVLLARAEEAREILPESLKALGADVWDVPAYRTILGNANKEKLKSLLREKEVTAVTFTSSSTVRNFLHLLDGEKELLQGVKLYSIGPITSQTARNSGLSVYREAKEYTIKGLTEALVEG
ncbi:MAG: uroporphyrinogen-III synthase, partial [Desulfitobacterium sp.]|nr:uroporphyrinogen-III synthase [Desulfitobacterium sp.]